MTEPRIFSILIAALGGEGGGVLSNWLTQAAERDGFIVQNTSIPGVAQRTGATTYYLEFYPAADAPEGRMPVMGLLPTPGEVDVVMATEIVEAGRIIFNGFVVPERTTLIASSHRIYSISEKMALADGRIDTTKIHQAAKELAKASYLFDMHRLAEQSGAMINAVLMGTLAGTDAAPVSAEAMKAAITSGGIAVEANLAGFEAGYAAARDGAIPDDTDATDATEVAGAATAGLPAEMAGRIAQLPEAVRDVAGLGLARTIGYQGPRYGGKYLDRLEQVAAKEHAHGGEGRGFSVSSECARYLALWMTYEDIICVAAEKTRPERMAEIRAEARAAPGQPVVITEFLKPGLEEWCSLMPSLLGRGARKLGYALGLEHKLNVGLKIKTTSITGFTLLWLLAKLKWWRPMTLRYREEQKLIERWLALITSCLETDGDLAREIALCANLNKGYGETLLRGAANLKSILDALPGLRAQPDAAAQVKALREAALADPERTALEQRLAEITQTSAA